MNPDVVPVWTSVSFKLESSVCVVNRLICDLCFRERSLDFKTLFAAQLDKSKNSFSVGEEFALTELFLYVCFFPPLSFHYSFTSVKRVKLKR